MRVGRLGSHETLNILSGTEKRTGNNFEQLYKQVNETSNTVVNVILLIQFLLYHVIIIIIIVIMIAIIIIISYNNDNNKC